MKLGKFYHLARCGKRCKRDELNLGGDQVEDSLALEHVEVCLHLLKVGEALVLQEGVDSNQHLLEDLPRFAQPRMGKIVLHSNLIKTLTTRVIWRDEGEAKMKAKLHPDRGLTKGSTGCTCKVQLICLHKC